MPIGEVVSGRVGACSLRSRLVFSAVQLGESEEQCNDRTSCFSQFLHSAASVAGTGTQEHTWKNWISSYGLYTQNTSLYQLVLKNCHLIFC